MSNQLTINDTTLPVVEYRGERVITLAMIDKVHQRPEGTARRNFNEHRARFVEGEDFVELTANEIRTQSLSIAFPARTPKGILLTESGYLMLVKPFTDDLAWDVQRKLVKSYFVKAPTPEQPDVLATLPAEHRALVAIMIDNVSIKVKQAEQDAIQSAQADSIKRIEAKQCAVENGAAYFTVIGYGTWRGITFSLTDAAALGRRASTLSKAAGIAVDTVRDPRFGKVNSYHESMLEEALSGLHGGM
jgi:hypothetical protein